MAMLLIDEADADGSQFLSIDFVAFLSPSCCCYILLLCTALGTIRWHYYAEHLSFFAYFLVSGGRWASSASPSEAKRQKKRVRDRGEGKMLFSWLDSSSPGN